MEQVKVCKKCKQEKILTCFQFQINIKNITYYSKTCKPCSREKANKIQKEWRFNNKQHIKKYNSLNKDKAKARWLKFKNKDKEEYNKKRREYYIKNKGKFKLNKEKKKIRDKRYYQKNKSKIRQKVIQKRNLKKINYPTYRLRLNVSRAISRGLRANNGSKLGNSCMNFLSYSMMDLKNHLEQQFEPWMTWNNYGIYNAKKWNDQDSATWTWQIDHIIPHSTFQYTSMKDEEFKKCWSLDNLRPYSAKQNCIDGVNRTRHRGL